MYTNVVIFASVVRQSALAGILQVTHDCRDIRSTIDPAACKRQIEIKYSKTVLADNAYILLSISPSFCYKRQFYLIEISMKRRVEISSM